MTSHRFSRRTLLRGVGVSMALPWLESLPVWGDEPAKSRASEAPVRLAVFFSGNGYHSKEWWAEGEGAGLKLGQVLAPLAELREKLLFVKGLYNVEATKGNIHSSQTGNILSGAPLASGGEIRSGTSFDQLLAQTYGRSTRVPSLVLACEKSNPSVHKNYSMLYSSHISWSSPTTPTPLEIYPALAFDRLFKDEVAAGRQERARCGARRRAPAAEGTVCPHRSGQARRVPRIGSRRGARHRAAREEPELQGWRPPRQAQPSASRARRLPQDIDEHMRLMCDILVLGSRPTPRASPRSSSTTTTPRCASRTSGWTT